ncbi:TolB family protein [Micromonospora sp. DT47]|uniref:TolB family protein n=1 Tax=Micromonospora sp. DT47 TaxID=3393431 RepID=UPI003CF17AF5
MSRPVEDALRAAVHDLAGQARPAPDLAAAALERGRRRRARRRATVTGAALVALAALALPFALLRPDRPAEPAHPRPTPTPSTVRLPTPGADWQNRPLTLPGGWVVTGGVTNGFGYVLDRTRSRYAMAEGYAEVWPAPAGTVTAVRDDQRPGQLGLADTATAKVRWQRIRGWTSLQWSPDGRRLAVTASRGGERYLGVLEVGGRYREYRVDRIRYFCTDFCAFTWTRDGREVTLPLTDEFKPHDESKPRQARWGVQFFSADEGRPTRFVKIPGDPAGPWAWSPDGERVVVQGQQEPLLVDAATGTVLGTLPAADVAWVTDERLLYRRPGGYRDVVLADTAGHELERLPLPRELAERTVSVAPK